MSVQSRLKKIERLSSSASSDETLALLRLAGDSSWEVRLELLEQVWGLDVALLRVVARALMTDPQPLVRARATDALGEFGQNQDIKRLRSALTDTDWGVRSSAASSLARFRTVGVCKALLTALISDPDAIVRRDAAYALSHFNGSELAQALKTALEHEKDNHPKSGILFALYRLGNSERLDPYLQMLHDEDLTVRHQAVNNLKPSSVFGEDVPKVLNALRRAIQQEAIQGVKEDAELALGRFAIVTVMP